MRADWDSNFLSDEAVLRIGSALAEIEPTGGFQMLMDLLRREREAAGQRFILDETTSKKFARGYLAGLDFLLGHVPELIREARELKAQEEEGGAFVNARFSGSSGSLA
jgi:hypothetical protein